MFKGWVSFRSLKPPSLLSLLTSGCTAGTTTKPYCLQDIVDTPPWPARDDFSPRLVRDDVLMAQEGPVWTRFGFEPFEVVDMIPMVGYRVQVLLG